MKLNKKKSIILAIIVVILLIAGVLVFTNTQFNDSSWVPKFPQLNFGDSAATEKIVNDAVDNLNKKFLDQGRTASLIEFSEKNGVIELTLSVNGVQYKNHITKDGELFFPEALQLGAEAQ